MAALLLFWDLGSPYLWQDEAATAILGERLFEHGKPLAYDGKNLVSMDSFADEDPRTIDQRTTDADATIRYLVERGDFRSDLAWTGQPWGQFLLAGASLRIFGHHTTAARVPFAIAGFLTVLILYAFARRVFGTWWMAAISAGLLLSNVYWILHARQARYYSLSGLFLLLTVIAFLHWRKRGRHGALLFVLAGWSWFQIDFGTFWPVVGALALLAMVFGSREPGNLRRVLLTFGSLLTAVAPWIWFYELLDRVKDPASSLSARFLGNLFLVNQFLIPVAVYVIGAIGFWRGSRKRSRSADSSDASPESRDTPPTGWTTLHERASSETRVAIAACLTIVPALYLWVSFVAPWHFYRYFVALTPLAALYTAWIVLESSHWVCRVAGAHKTIKIPLTITFAIFLAVTPLASNALSVILPAISVHPRGVLVRPELGLLGSELFGARPDPNRIVVEYLRGRANPEDEILATYEDLPLQFYLDNPIRGGVTAFRAEDPANPPRFLVVRQSVSFLHWPVFQREIGRHRWNTLPVHAPDVPFGNNPDPEAQIRWAYPNPPDMIVAERAASSD